MGTFLIFAPAKMRNVPISVSLALTLLAVPAAGSPALACNPAPPRPAALQGYPYDATAAETLLQASSSVVVARLALRIDVALEQGGKERAEYVFDIIEGWKAELPQRLVIGGYWVDCALDLRPGQEFLLYLEGSRLLHAVPLEQTDLEARLLGGPDWFFDAGGRRVSPELPQG